MEKAYDLKGLGEEIRKQLDLKSIEVELQTLGKAVYFGFKQWLKDSSALSESNIIHIVTPFIDQLDGFVLPQLEKIDLDGQPATPATKA